MNLFLFLSLCLSFSDTGLIDELEADVGDWQNTTINGTLQSRTHGDAHELTAVGANSLALDAKGNTTTDDQSRSFVWDFDNRLRSSNASGAGGSAALSFTYDALGRRVSKTASSSGGGSGTTTTVYVCSGQQVVSEYLSGQPASNPIQSYVYGTYVDEPLLKIASGVKHYYHTNRQFCVTALTDSSAAIQERYAYTPYGQTTILAPNGTTIRTVSTFSNPYMYTGRRLDAETELYYYRARYYDSNLGRFINRDPIHYEGSPWNLYEYVSGKSYRHYDPGGNNIYLETGNVGGGPINNAVHQSICVDTWNARNISTGKRCFSFGMTGVGFWFGRNWLGFRSYHCCTLTGKIYEPAPVAGAIIAGVKATTIAQDRRWLRYIVGRIGTPGCYSVARHNCRKFSQLEFAIAP